MVTKKQMKRFSWLGIVILTVFLVVIGGGETNFSLAATAKYHDQLEFPPLPEVKLPEYERYELNNGMVIYLIEDKELPLVGGSAIIRTGSRWEDGNETGLAQITGTVMRTGGTMKHPPDQLNEMLEQRAASVETFIGDSSGGGSFSALSEDFPTVFALFAEVLRSPAFSEAKIELAKTQEQGNIARRNDDPGAIASREFRKLVYGQESPYARTTEYATLGNIERQDLVDYYNQYFHPEDVILGIVGDFNAQEVKELIEAKFGDWQPASGENKLTVPQATQKNSNGIFFVNQPQLTQSNILLGHLGGQFDNPDYPELNVMNEVLNGFGGRLFNEVRSRQGLAYSVYGFWSPRYDYPGIFIAGGQTRSEATVPFIKSIKAEIAKLRTEPITAQELANAKESILNSFVFNFADPSQTLSRLMRYEYYGYPADFIFEYQRQVKATTIADIQRVAQKYLQPEQIVTIVVGNGEEIQPPLQELDVEVETLDIAIKEE
ncbi:MAG: pitrilysin family protein [Spirulinaceae cyanobacterium]